MITVLVAPLFLLLLIFFDGPVSRLIGAKIAATVLFSTGLVIVPVVTGLTWQTAIAGVCDLAVLLGGAALARGAGAATRTCGLWMRRMTLAFSAFLFLSFAGLAPIAILLGGISTDAVTFGFGLLISGIAFALALS